MKTPAHVIEFAMKQGVRMVDLKFVDTFGSWQHFSIPAGELKENVFADGFGFDGSSIRGWKSIEASDMLAIPDPQTAFIDPFCQIPTLSLTCTIVEPGTKRVYDRDPRGMAHRAEQYLKSTGIADTAVFGPEAEFFIFDNVQYDEKAHGAFFKVDVKKLPGTPAAMKCQIWVPRSVTRRAISRSLRLIPSRIFELRWCS